MPMLLDPRNHNPNILLRGSEHPKQYCGIYKFIPLMTQKLWGISAWDVPLLSVDITADGIPISPGDRIWRPSHVTRNGYEPDSGIQLSEHTFVNTQGIAICAFQLRNAGDYSIRINITPHWNHAHPHHPVRVSNPPGDNLNQVLPRDCRVDYVFACTWDSTLSQDDIDAPAGQNDPTAPQVDAFTGWYSDNAPLLSSTNPWLDFAWAFGHYIRWAAPMTTLPAAPFTAIANLFTNGIYGAPNQIHHQTPDDIITNVFGIRATSAGMVVDPNPDHIPDAICLTDILIGQNRYSIVWDSPAVSDDHFDDGDKGFTVYHGSRRIFHSDALTSFHYPA